jgi:hypothetical protein
MVPGLPLGHKAHGEAEVEWVEWADAEDAIVKSLTSPVLRVNIPRVKVKLEKERRLTRNVSRDADADVEDLLAWDLSI